MNQILKTMTSTSAAFIIAAALTAPAMADGPKANFSDITAESPYYEAVNYFAGKKILTGTSDGCFHPETGMTPGEWAAVLSRVNEISGKESPAYAAGLKQADGSAGTISPEPAVTSMPAAVYNSIWQIAGVKTYSARDYGFASDLDAGTTAMFVTGLIDRNAVNQTSISRGDALNLLYEVTVKKAAAEVPSNLIAFFDVSADCEAPEETEALLRKLMEAYPNNQLALLLAYDYNFEIRDDLSSLPVEYSDTLLGLEDDGQHTIYLEKEAVPEWALHEIGHAVETCNCSYSATIALNKAEGKAGVELFGEYAGVNRSEFIAEAASYFMRNRNNETALQAMKETMPQTYEHFTKLVEKEPFLNESYFFDIVERK